MLHFIYVALPFLVFAMYRSLTNLEPFSKLIHRHTAFSFRVLFCIFEIWSSFIQQHVLKVKNFVLFCLYCLPVCVFFSLFPILSFSIIYFIISHPYPSLVPCFSILICPVLSLCFCRHVLLSVPLWIFFRFYSSSKMNARNNLFSRGNSWHSRSPS